MIKKKQRVETQDAGAGESSTVFVGNMSWNTDEDSLRAHFKKCGTIVSARIGECPGWSWFCCLNTSVYSWSMGAWHVHSGME